jgi:hypothetical protein
MTLSQTSALPITHPLPRVFTPALARASGVDRVAVERLLRRQMLRRVRRGVLAPVEVPDDLEVRAAALALVVAPGRVVTGRSAAWLHGVEAGGADVLELAPARPALLVARDVQRCGGVLVTTPVRTAADLGRELPVDEALGVLDAFLRAGVAHGQLLDELARHTGLRGVAQLRRLAPLADARARDPCESVVRLRWLDAGLPTPVPGLTVSGQRLVLGLAVQRFGVTLDAAGAPGWRVVALSRSRVLDGDAGLLERHLGAQFHQALLQEVV